MTSQHTLISKQAILSSYFEVRTQMGQVSILAWDLRMLYWLVGSTKVLVPTDSRETRDVKNPERERRINCFFRKQGIGRDS